MDLGIGLDHVDSVLRMKQGTLKKSVMAGKLQRDSLGEELRILYVAMTRAQEKLILTGSLKAEGAEKLQAEEARQEGLAEKRRAESSARMPGEPDVFRKGGLLPYFLRAGASCYLDWLLPAWRQTGQKIGLADASRLLAGQVKKEQSREERLLGLKALLHTETESAQMPEAESAQDALIRLKARLRSEYPHQNLAALYAKTTVSELKKAGMAEAAEEAYHLFEEEEVIPYLPRFVRSEDRMGGAARGSAYHKALELLPFADWQKRKGAEPAEAQLKALLDQMQKQGKLPPEYRQAVSPRRLALFLNSSLAGRMARADGEGLLHKEQPFVLGLPASELGPGFPEEETVLIQGIIDVYFEEDGELVVADYKTDAVSQPQELVNRYRVQLDYYARALEQLTRKRVKEKIIYSFALQKEIVLREMEEN